MSLILEAWRQQSYAPAGGEQLLKDDEDKLQLEQDKQDLIYALKYLPAPPPAEQYTRDAKTGQLGSGTFGMDDYSSLSARPDEQRAMASNGSSARADANDPGARRQPPWAAGQTREPVDALPQKAQTVPTRSAAWAPGQAGGGRGFVNPSPDSARGNPPFAERSKVTDASADSQPMGYGEQMRYVGKFFGDVAIGAAKGLVKSV